MVHLTLAGYVGIRHSMLTDTNASARRAMNISVVAGVGMLVLKFTAYALTGSTAIMSDAAESIIHVMAVLFAAYSLRLSTKPADQQHPYGHAKVSFFSAGAEGALILMAAIVIIYTAIQDWLGGLQLKRLDVGVALTALASIINAGLGWYLVRTGRRSNSIVLEANGQHVLTDCWTSIGVVIGLLLAWLTGWLFLDPLCAILVALNIVFSGVRLIQRSVGGLMDEADPGIQRQINDVLDTVCARNGISHHLMRQRFNGYAYEVDVHLLFPDEMAIKEAHRIATATEEDIAKALPMPAIITTHLEPREDHHHIHPE